jgi:hypothetical protein
VAARPTERAGAREGEERTILIAKARARARARVKEGMK